MGDRIFILHTTHTDTPGRVPLCTLRDYPIELSDVHTDAVGVNRRKCIACRRVSHEIRERDAMERERRQSAVRDAPHQIGLFTA